MNYYEILVGAIYTIYLLHVQNTIELCTFVCFEYHVVNGFGIGMCEYYMGAEVFILYTRILDIINIKSWNGWEFVSVKAE